jgi:very-short-patch-repair endonuclease
MSLNKKKELRLIAKVLCRELRKNQTAAEGILWERIRNKKLLGKKFYRQYPIFFDYLGRETFFIADFYCHSSKLVIEIDGKIHNYQKENDRLRDQLINLKGIEVLRINNVEIENDLEKVIDKIKIKLN